MAESNDDQKRVTIALKTVYCHKAQGVMDVDAFYVAGGAATGPRSGSKSMTILTSLVEIDSRQKKIFAGDGCIIFDGNVHVDDFVELGLQFRSMNVDVDESDFDDKYSALVSALTADVGAGVGSLAASASAKGAVAGAILSATSPALARVQARASMYEDDVLGTVQKRVNVFDYPDGHSGPFTWKFADKYPNIIEGPDAWSEWDYEVGYTVEVGPAR
ncbi:hypothetical protein [Nonomuraea jabiensis]|uniref:hypothetical protein n=1 Tax=Nonomuraea jabiensis TaxID=882448 RepID=UPI0036B08A18